MLTLVNIKKTYQLGDEKIHALKKINLSFRESEFVSVLGPSGCGKTTLMNIVGGLDNDKGGDLIIDGQSTKGFKDKDWDNYRNKRVGFIFQSYYLIPHLSIVANVELALTIAGISKEERTKRAVEALRRVGLEKQLKKKPNQLSGGQMQRVSIARALVNSPEILLADEPTGALDTKTSEQILDLIKEISKERLVIMVTHNSELANTYSTRIIRMLDGEVTEDSNPFEPQKEVKPAKKVSTPSQKPKEKSRMSLWTAFTLSFKNLLTKKGRTFLTSFAGSIGIIGIAVVLALSAGMNNYIAKVQADSLSSTPITISTSVIDFEQAIIAMQESVNKTVEKFPGGNKIISEKVLDQMTAFSRKNKITEEYIDYLKTEINPEWVNGIDYSTGVDFNLFGKSFGSSEYSLVSLGSSDIKPLLNQDFISTQYDVLAGRLPVAKEELVLIVNEYNGVSENILVSLGLKKAGEDVVITFEDVLTKEYKLVKNDDIYYFDENIFKGYALSEIDFAGSDTIKIVGIIRNNSETQVSSFSSGEGGVAYLSELEEYVLTINGTSEIVEWMKDPANALKNPITGLPYLPSMTSFSQASAEDNWNSAIRGYGGVSLPNSINIYPKDFEAKEKVKKVLDKYNERFDEAHSEYKITYSDMSQLFSNMISNLINVITYVLIGFTAISLVVSCVMIGIITYISVIERTKEIGVLRSIGARKKDVTRVFNSETFIIGAIAGILGVGIAYLLTIPINLIIGSLAGITGIAYLSPTNALTLVAISIVLTLLSGLLPARGAAKKDPVLALRSE